MLSELLRQVPDAEAVEELVRRFDKSPRKYARYLRYEDAYNDLLTFFIELIQSAPLRATLDKGDGVIVNYIAKSIKGEYIKLSKSIDRNILPFSDLNDETAYMLEAQMSYTQEYDLGQYWASEALTNTEEMVIRMIYERGYSVPYTAELLGKTRQAINQTKLRALKKIKKEIENNI